MIKKIKLENYKVFENLELDFTAVKQIKTQFKDYDVNGILNVLAITGGNASGKTVLLKAIPEYFSLLSASITYEKKLKGYLDSQKDFKEYVNFRKAFNNFKTNNLNGNESITDEIEVEKEAQTGANRYFNSLFNDFSRPVKISHEFISETGAIFLGEVEITKLANGFSINRSVEIKKGKNVRKYFNDQINDEFLADKNICSEFIIDSVTYFSVSDDRLLTKHTAVLNGETERILKQAIRIIEPECLDLTFNEFNEIKDLVFERKKGDGFNFISYHNASTGTRKFLNLLNMLLQDREKKSVLIFDEFESYLHPDLTRWLINLVRDNFFPRLKLVISTHNPEFLDELRKDQIYLLKDKQAFRATEIGIRQDKKFSNSYRSSRIADGPNEEQFFEMLDLLGD